MTSTPITSEAQWHGLRASTVGSSEVAALFDASEWLSHFALWHMKAGALSPPPQTSAMTRGKFFEPAIAALAESEFGIRLEKAETYLTSDTCPGLGASIDYYEILPDGGMVPTEIKYSLWGGGWEHDGPTLTEAPLGYQLQVQTQLACCPAAPYGQIIAELRSGLKRMICPREPMVIAEIERRVARFWESVRAKEEPAVDYRQDADAVMRLYARAAGEPVDLTGSNRATWLAGRAVEMKAAMKALDDEYAATIAELIRDHVRLAPRAVIGEYRVSATEVASIPPKIVTPEMVGTEIGGRAGYRRVSVTVPKVMKEAA